MKFKVFWTTFIGLSVFAFAVFSWALIFSPIHFEPQIIGEFEGELNGSKQKNQIWVNSGNLRELQLMIAQEWIKQGWNPVAQGRDFAPVLLGLDKKIDVLSPYLQMKIFEKGETYRVLSLLQDSENDQTYGWVSETPKNIFDVENARTHWNFPFNPPAHPKRLLLQSSEGCQMAYIFLEPSNNFFAQFQDLCTTQNFDQHDLGHNSERQSFMLKKGNLRLLAMLESGATENVISLVYFNKK